MVDGGCREARTDEIGKKTERRQTFTQRNRVSGRKAKTSACDQRWVASSPGVGLERVESFSLGLVRFRWMEEPALVAKAAAACSHEDFAHAMASARSSSCLGS